MNYPPPMPDLLESPPFPARSLANLRPYDHARAKAAGAKSAQVRRERAKARLLAAIANHVTQVAEPDERLTLIAEQIARTRKALNVNDLPGHHRAALLRSLCALMEQQRIARGEPLPGSRRPREDGDRGGRRSRMDSALLIEEAPVQVQSTTIVQPPAPVQPSRPMGWEYDDPNATTTPRPPDLLPGNVTP